jgi:hypothetical protein
MTLEQKIINAEITLDIAMKRIRALEDALVALDNRHFMDSLFKENVIELTSDDIDFKSLLY